MVETLFTKLLNTLTEPSQLILLLWIVYCMKQHRNLQEINEKLLSVQQDRSVTLTKLMTMIESMFRDSKGGAK